MQKCTGCGKIYDSRYMVVCPECNAEKFVYVCDNCGQEFEGKFCPTCGVGVGQSAKICPNCGKRYFTNACPDCGTIEVEKTVTTTSGASHNVWKLMDKKAKLIVIAFIIGGFVLAFGLKFLVDFFR